MSGAARAELPTVDSSPADPDDHVARWFEEMHRTGDHLGIRFGRLAHSGAGAPEWVYLPHWRYDGIGALGELLRERGVPGLAQLPGLKRPGRPGRVRALRAVARLLGRMGSDRPWLVPGPRFTDPGPERARCGNALGYRVLSVEQTRALQERARSLGASLNSLLLHGADRVAREGWLPAGTRGTTWMVPVNLRGGVQLRRDTANHLGLMDVALPPEASPAQVHARVREELAHDGPWGTWHFFRLSHLLGPARVRAVVSQEARRGVIHAGLFSNLGDWGPAEGGLEEARASWIFAPQTTRKVPVSLGAVVWGGRLALAVQAHPLLGASPEQADRWAQRWAELAAGA